MLVYQLVYSIRLQHESSQVASLASYMFLDKFKFQSFRISKLRSVKLDPDASVYQLILSRAYCLGSHACILSLSIYL